MFFADAVPKKEVARRFGLDVKTVRRASEQNDLPLRRTAYFGRKFKTLDSLSRILRAWHASCEVA
jgi:hypothetical protein